MSHRSGLPRPPFDFNAMWVRRASHWQIELRDLALAKLFVTRATNYGYRIESTELLRLRPCLMYRLIFKNQGGGQHFMLELALPLIPLMIVYYRADRGPFRLGNGSYANARDAWADCARWEAANREVRAFVVPEIFFAR